VATFYHLQAHKESFLYLLRERGPTNGNLSANLA